MPHNTQNKEGFEERVKYIMRKDSNGVQHSDSEYPNRLTRDVFIELLTQVQKETREECAEMVELGLFLKSLKLKPHTRIL